MTGQNVTLSSKIYGDFVGATLVNYLTARFPYKNQSQWVEQILAGKVLVNQKKVEPEYRLLSGDKVSYTSFRVEPEVQTEIPILFEDEYLLVVDKPAPLPVHADGRFIVNTLISLIKKKTGNPDLRLVHRLDRETSGVLILAKDKSTTSDLMAQFENQQVHKTYLALVFGKVTFKEKLVSGWMGPKKKSMVRIRQELLDLETPGFKESATRFFHKETFDSCSLLQCEPRSGRTNQIRVHAEAMGFPIVGDKLYGRSDQEFLNYLDYLKSTTTLSGFRGGPRLMLHASKLGLVHPVTEKNLFWESSTPADMLQFIQALP